MNKSFIGILAIVCSVMVSLSILGGFYILSESSKKQESVVSSVNSDTTKEVMNEQELASYLGLTTSNIEDILKQDASIKQQTGGGVFDTYQFLPYFQTASGQKIFYKEEVNNWLSYQTKKIKS